MPPERPLLSHRNLALIDTVARAVARAKKLPPEDVEHFAQHVRASIADSNSAPLRHFEGRASFRTYLTIVVARQLKAVTAATNGSGDRAPSWIA